jgi:hypothetical protein
MPDSRIHERDFENITQVGNIFLINAKKVRKPKLTNPVLYS